MSFSVVGQDETFRGRTYGDWYCDWWNWVIAIDPKTEEELHQSGPLIFCRGGANLYGQDGAVLNIGKRKLHISKDQAIFVAIMPTVADNVNTPDCDTEEKRRAFVRTATDESQKPEDMIFMIDDNDARGELRRIETPAFKLNMPDAPYGKLLGHQMDFLKPIQPGSHEAVADGYVGIINFRTPPDHHTLYFKAGGRYGYLVEALYEIDIDDGTGKNPDNSVIGEGMIKVPGKTTQDKLERMAKELGLDPEQVKNWKKKLDARDWSFEWRQSTA